MLGFACSSDGWHCVGAGRLPGVGLAAGPPDFRSKVGLRSAGELVAGVGLRSAGELVAGVGLSSAGELVAGVGLASAGEIIVGKLGLERGESTRPGPTCLTAGLLALGVPSFNYVTIGSTDWWYIPVVAGNTYTVTYSAATSDILLGTVLEGTCSGYVLLQSFGASPPLSFTFVASASDYVFVQLKWVLTSGPVFYQVAITSP